MKPSHRNPLLRLALATSICLCFGHSANATTYYWDGGTTNITTAGDALSNPGANGNWDATLTNWDQAPFGSAHIAWPNANPNGDTAEFAGSARTVTTPTLVQVNVGTLNIRTNSYIFGPVSTLAAPTPGKINLNATSAPAVIDVFQYHRKQFQHPACRNLQAPKHR